MVGNQNVVEFYGGSSLKETSIKSKGRFQNQMDGVSDFLPSNTLSFHIRQKFPIRCFIFFYISFSIPMKLLSLSSSSPNLVYHHGSIILK